MKLSLSRTLSRATLMAALCALTFVADAPRHAARAQAIALSVNGDPITNIDLEQRMKLLRAIHKPATREAAVESMIETRLKANEASHLGINVADNQIGEQVASDAKKMKTSPTALINSMTAAGVSQAHLTTYFKVRLAYGVLIRALNRGVEASEVAVRQEMAQGGGQTSEQTYSLRQIVFTGSGDNAEALNASVKQAEALRAKFNGCTSGLPYAKTLPGVAIREPITRSSAELQDAFKEVLDKTPVGHLTPPSRSPNGIELIAVCSKTGAGKDERRKTIAERLLSEHLAQQEAQKYKELRAEAVIKRVQ